jgi:hypothetical protein
MPDKLPYQTKLKLTSMRPDAISEALTKLREMMSEYDQTGEASATLTIEANKYADLEFLMNDFESWLLNHQIGIEAEWSTRRPAVRPETLQVRLRAAHRTPMDTMLRDALGESDDER